MDVMRLERQRFASALAICLSSVDQLVRMSADSFPTAAMPTSGARQVSGDRAAWRVRLRRAQQCRGAWVGGALEVVVQGVGEQRLVRRGMVEQGQARAELEV